MSEEIPAETRRKVIERLESLPRTEFRRGDSKHFSSPPYSVSGASGNVSSYDFYNSKTEQLFSLVCVCWTRYEQNMADEIETTEGKDYYLRIYPGEKKDKCDFECSGKDIENLYRGIELGLEKEAKEKEKRRIDSAKNKLEQFLER